MKLDNQTEWKYILYVESKPDFSPPKLMHAKSELRKIYNTAPSTQKNLGVLLVPSIIVSYADFLLARYATLFN